MTDKWIIEDIERKIKNSKRIVILDPLAQYAFLLPHIQQAGYIILSTDNNLSENWQTVKEEMFLRFQAENEYADRNVVLYINRPQEKLTFLFDYSVTHGCIDLSNSAEWLKKKVFSQTAQQVNMENPMLITAAKLGVGKDLSWWKRILQNLEDLVTIDEELLPFLSDPAKFFKNKEPDVKRLFEEKLFELLGQPYMSKPPKTLASEITKLIFDQLLHNDIQPELLKIYHKCLDSKSYADALNQYIANYKIESSINIWNLHPDHCLSSLDLLQLKEIASNVRDKGFVKEKLQKIKLRLNSRFATNYIPSWWSDIIVLFEFNNQELAACSSLDKLIKFYTSKFNLVDRAIRNIYNNFIQEENIVRPLQELYESLNYELLEHWFELSNEYQTNQQGYLPQLLKTSKPGVAVIVGDAIRYEMAAYVADQLKSKLNITTDAMQADMPSETEHNMSALFLDDGVIMEKHKDREKMLTEKTGLDIQFAKLDALHYGLKSDYLILTYGDVDKTGESMQLGALKLFKDFENLLIEKIQLLLNMGYNEVHLITDHGYVLTGLLTESDKIEPIAKGAKEVHERFIRTVDLQPSLDWVKFDRKYKEYNYVYTPKSHRPFKSKGAYGFSHGGFTPQEIILPQFVFRKKTDDIQALDVKILNKQELQDVTGELFGIKIHATSQTNDLFSSSRKIQVKLYANNHQYSSSNIVQIEPDITQSFDFSFSGNSEITAVILDAETQEQIDSVKIIKSNARDLGGLL